MVVFNNAMAGAAGSGGAAEYTIDNSLRFNSADSSHLKKIFGSDGTLTAWTFSCWVKRSALGTNQSVFTSGDYGAGAAARSGLFRFGTGDKLEFQMYKDGGSTLIANWVTTQVFRDPSAWQHLVLVYDSSNGTTADRTRLYVNGTRVTAFDGSPTYPSPSQDSAGINTTGPTHYFGGYGGTSATSMFLNAYLADAFFIDGQALSPTDFGAFDATTGVWNPIEYTGTYGTNGFYLPFNDNSSASALGTDASPNGNNWTVNNINLTQGNGSWISQVQGTNYSNLYGIPQMFDASLATEMLAQGGTTTTFTPTNGLAFSSSFVIYAYDGNGGTIRFNWSGGYYDLNLPTTNTSNPIDVTSNLTSPITSITWSTPDIQGPYIRAIDVDGVRLIDHSYTDYDSLKDSPTNGDPTLDTGLGGELPGNYATWNPLDSSSLATGGNGNLEAVLSGGNATYENIRATQSIQTKTYWETTVASNTTYQLHGIARSDSTIASNGSGGIGYSYVPDSVGFSCNIGYIFENDALVLNTSISPSAGDVIMHAYDPDTGKYWMGHNNTWFNSGDPAAGTGQVTTLSTSKKWMPAVSSAATQNITANFGQRPFAYQAPAGFKCLCTANLPDPDIADGSTAMDVIAYNGTGTTHTRTDLSFQPELVWLKARNDAYWHHLYDAVRGAEQAIFSNDSFVEVNKPTGLTAFTSNGFTLGSDVDLNKLNQPNVAWCWDAGGAPTTDNIAGAGNVPTAGSVKVNGANMTTALAGSIPATRLSANTNTGFSIVSYTGVRPGAQTVGHGLNVAPEFIAIKCRSNTVSWGVYHSALGASSSVSLDQTLAAGSTVIFGNTAPTSSVFTVGDANTTNENGGDFIAYCWAPVEGYSAFGTSPRTGFVYTGHRPAFLLMKTLGTGNWVIVDSARGTGEILLADDPSSYLSTTAVDFTANGFNLTSSIWGATNDIIWASFAENPFKYARAR